MKVFRYSKDEKTEAEALSTIEGFPHLYDDNETDDMVNFSNNDATVADDDDAGQPVKAVADGSKKRRILCFSGVALVLILVISLGSYGISNKKTKAPALSSSNFCQPASIKDTKEPFLELMLFAGTNRLVNDMEAKFLENAVMEGYNEASGGCTDLYERWTYGESGQQHLFSCHPVTPAPRKVSHESPLHSTTQRSQVGQSNHRTPLLRP
jgi:hypothetical protein